MPARQSRDIMNRYSRSIMRGEHVKIGVITDIHNNVAALKAAVEYLYQQGCVHIICCGDIIGIGPHPEETVQYLRSLSNVTAVRGNHETYLLEGMPDAVPNEERMDWEEMKHHKWEHSLLSAESVAYLKSLPYGVDMTCEGFRIAVMHYCMDRDGHYVRYTPEPSETDLEKMFADVDADVILYGHDHRRWICCGKRMFVNVGSLGCPAKDGNIARAGILTIEEGRADIQPVDVAYHVQNVIRDIDEIQYPDAENIKKYFYGV